MDKQRTEMGELGTELSMLLSIGGVAYTVTLVGDEYNVVSWDGLRVGGTPSFTHAVELAAMDAAFWSSVVLTGNRTAIHLVRIHTR